MAIVDTFGKCKCGEFNALSAVACHGCGSRLAWANMPSGMPSNMPAGGTKNAGTARAQNAQANYWGAALSGQVGASSHNDPDIDFTPFGGGAAANSASGAGVGGAGSYCSYCGTGLRPGQAICHSCRHMTAFTKADLRFTVMISSLLVSGFLLGVVWTAVVLNAANTGEWRLPNVQYTKTQAAPTKKPLAKPNQPASPAVDEYGKPKR